MSSRLLSPRARPPALDDLGERSTLIARQRPGRSGRRRRPVDPAAARRRRRRRLLGAGLGLVALLGLAAGGHWLLTSPRFAVTSVAVRGTSRVPPERILAASGIVSGVNLFRLDPAAVVAGVQSLPEIARAELVRELPNRVTIVVEERRPFTLVSSGRLHWLDEEGHLLGEADQAVAPPVPVISGLGEEELAALRTAPGPKARAALALIRSLLRAGSPLASAISEIDMSGPEGPVLYTVTGIEVRLGTEEWDERLARLEGVLAQLAAEGAAVQAIDLRFRDQVVLKGGQG